MMNIKLLALFAFIVISCNSSNNDLYQFVPRTLENNHITLSEIADEITYIPLDNFFPIGFIYSPRYITSTSIYLSAKEKGILEFDRNGKFIRKIGKLGRGPGEYVYCNNFAVDGNTGKVGMLENNSIKLYSKSGNFLRSISIDKFGEGASTIEFYNSLIFISSHLQYPGVKYNWIVLDTLGNLINIKERTDSLFTSNYSINGGMYKYDGTINYWSPYCDTVFSISSDLKYKPSFLINPGEHRLPRSNFKSPDEIKLYFKPRSLIETNRFLVFRYTYESRVSIALIEKESQKSYLTHLASGHALLGDSYIGGIQNDFDGGVKFQPENYFSENNQEYLFALIDALQIKNLLNSDEFKNSASGYSEKKKELENLATSIKETDNQILMIARLKK